MLLHILLRDGGGRTHFQEFSDPSGLGFLNSAVQTSLIELIPTMYSGGTSSTSVSWECRWQQLLPTGRGPAV